MSYFILSYSYLYIARSEDPPIMRYNPSSGSTIAFNYDGSAQSISVDEYSNVIYWANYNANSGKFEVLKTSYIGDTVKLNITYAGAIKVETDELNLFILDSSNMRIDKYLKSSLERSGNLTFDVAIADLVIGYGEFCCPKI